MYIVEQLCCFLKSDGRAIIIPYIQAIRDATGCTVTGLLSGPAEKYLYSRCSRNVRSNDTASNLPCWPVWRNGNFVRRMNEITLR